MAYKCEECGRESETQENCHDKPMAEKTEEAATPPPAEEKPE